MRRSSAVPRRRRGRRVPLALVALASCLLAAGGWYGWRWYREHHLVLAFTRAGGAVPAMVLTFFPDQLAFGAPSPPPPLGRVELAGDPAVTVGSELVPGRAVVRYEGAGVGAGFVHVQLGQDLPPIELRAPGVVQGRVGVPIGFWCFGWRCAGLRPVAGAEVVAMGGGEHGVPLATVRTDAEGRFRFDAIDSARAALGLRVRAAGFAIVHQAVPERVAADALQVVGLAPTTAVQGRVAVPAGVELAALRVLARGLPGVEAALDAAGSFTLDHVPPGLEPRLLVHGLGPGFGHAPVHASRSGPVQLDVVPAAVVRGRVVDVGTNAAIGGALVWCGDGDAVCADERGRFELPRILPGETEIRAQTQITKQGRRPVTRRGLRRVTLAGGQVVEGLVVAIDRASTQ